MASRPVFLPTNNERSLVEERYFDFSWASGFAESQKKKNIISLHDEAKKRGINSILEISTKSMEELGRRLSAFSLKIEIDGREYSLESVYQGAKKFEKCGPFAKIYNFSPRDAKKFIRELNSPRLVAFEIEGKTYPLSPKNAFYDWLYIRSLSEHADWIQNNVPYQAFTDIEFNPKKQVNCQARAFAEYISLLRRDKLEQAVEDFDFFASMLNTV